MKSENVKNGSPVVNKKTTKQNFNKIKKIKKQISETSMENLNGKRKTLKRKANESGTSVMVPKRQKVDGFKPLDKDRTVFVANIPIKTKEKDLKNFFSSYGEVETVIIHTNPNSKRKSITGKVCFTSPESAVKAKEAKIFNNFHIRVEPLKEYIKFDNEKTIHLSRVPANAEEDDVRKIFEGCGNVITVNLRRDLKTNLGKGSGYVHFDSTEAVDSALKLGVIKLCNKEVRVNRFNEASIKKKITEGKKEIFEIVISDLPEKTSECDLHELLGKCGRIRSSNICRKDRTFCFVNFEDSEGMQNAINMQNPEIFGVAVNIKEKTEKIREHQPAIYIKNLPLYTKSKQIFEIFKDCGTIAKITLNLKKDRPAGVGFVNFHQEDAIEKALAKTVYIGTNKLIITSNHGKPKTEERPGQLEKVKNDDVASSDNAEESEDDENDAESNDDEENGAESDDDEENDDEENGVESDDDEENDAESDDDEENSADEEEYKNELDKILMDADDSNDDDEKTSPKKITPKKNIFKQTPRKSVTPKKVYSKPFTPKSASKKVK